MRASIRHEELADRYQEMRAFAVGSVPGVVPHGVALLMRRGVPAWMEAWSLGASPPLPPRKVDAGPPSSPSVGGRVELVAALVEMALATPGR